MTPDWREALADTMASDSFQKLQAFVQKAYSSEHILPEKECLYAALQYCSLADTRVVILGQDPYPTPGHAHGLAFSVREPIAPPPSLRNMLKEICADVGGTQLQSGDLTPWARQGVLLLNAILTVRAGASLSHAGKGWESFTDAIIQTVAQRQNNVVFMLWGNKAQAKRKWIDESRHLVLTAAHPSPLSARNGFFGCRHFSQANAYLTAHGRTPIQW